MKVLRLRGDTITEELDTEVVLERQLKLSMVYSTRGHRFTGHLRV